MKKVFSVLMIFASGIFLGKSQSFVLKSKDAEGQIANKQVYNGFGCEGENLSPELYWENIPAGTKSFAVTVYDPDAPTGSGFWHWIVYNIPINITELKTGAGNVGKEIPKGILQGRNDFGDNHYDGPCPPKDDHFHAYHITVYALKCDKLNVDSTSNPALLGYNIVGNTIEKATVVLYYKRK